jgi:hypothetical protein
LCARARPRRRAGARYCPAAPAGTPRRVVGARWVVGEVEVQDQCPAVTSEVGAFGGVEDVTPARIGGAIGPGVLDWDKNATPVAGQPPDIKVAETVEMNDAGPLERDCAVGAGGHFHAGGLDIGAQSFGEPHPVVVRGHRHTAESGPLGGRDGRLGGALPASGSGYPARAGAPRRGQATRGPPRRRPPPCAASPAMMPRPASSSAVPSRTGSAAVCWIPAGRRLARGRRRRGGSGLRARR